MQELDSLDKQILDIIQTNFPIVSHPYKVLGEKLGVSEEEVFRRIQALKKNKIIRRLGANFQSSKLGFVSTLCAAKVPSEKMDSFIARVNSELGVTHNYIREHSYNVWFTLIAKSKEKSQEILYNIERETGISILNLPATKLFKIRVDFRMQEQE